MTRAELIAIIAAILLDGRHAEESVIDKAILGNNILE